MRLLYTAKAFSDIDSIGEFIREYNPARAESFVAEIFLKCRELQKFPNAYPLYAPSRDKYLRRRVHGNYLIFYGVDEDRVIILHVLRSSRDTDRIIFGDD